MKTEEAIKREIENINIAIEINKANLPDYKSAVALECCQREKAILEWVLED